MGVLIGLLFIAVASTTAATAAATTLEGRVVGIKDGDTLTLLVNREQYSIRLADIDAPEIQHGAKRPGQPFGERSRQSLAEMAHGKNAQAHCNSQSYERPVCRVYVEGGDINSEQVRRGMAWVEPRYNKDPKLPPMEAEARAQRRGLFQDAQAIPPWLWRKTVWETTR